MDTPVYEAIITIGGADQTTFFTKSFPDPREPNGGIITRQSGRVILTLQDADGNPFNGDNLVNTDVYVVPFNSGTAPVLLGSGVLSDGAGTKDIFTIEWVKDTIPASFSQFPQDDAGAIAMTFQLEETGSEDFYQFATRFNVFDGDLAGDASTEPLTPQTYSWADAIPSEWAKYDRGTPTTLVQALSYISGAGKNDWGTVIDKDLATAPVSPSDNDQYIIAGTGGDWSAFTINDIVRYSLTDLIWYKKTPTDGNFVFVADENLTYQYDGAAWANQQVIHTGQVTGGTVLTLDSSAIDDQSLVTATSGDEVLAVRAGGLQKIDVADFNGNMNTSTYDLAGIGEQLIGETATQSLSNKTVNGVILSNAGVATQFLDATGNYSTPAGGGDMDKATYDAANIAEQLVGLIATQSLTNKTVNGVILNSTGLPTAYLDATGAYSTPAGGGDMTAAVYDAAAVAEQLVGLTASQNMTNKSINGVTPVSGGSSAQYLSADGTYNTPAGAGDMLKAAYDPANINEQLVGLVSTQTLTNKTVNGVILNAAGSASLFLNEAGAYVTPAGGGDMVAAVYDAAGITEQLVGLTATQTLTNKTVNGVVLDAAGSSALFLNQIGTYSAPPSGGGAVDTVASADGSIAVTGTTDIDLSVTRKDLPNNQTGLTYTFVLTDAGKTVWGENASAQEFTIPTNASVAFPINTTILVMQEGAGAVTITGDTGVTVNNVLAKSETINTQFQGAILVKRGTDDWKISGDIGTGGGGGGSTNWTLTTSSVTAAAGEKHISSGVSTIITFPSAPDDGTPIEVIRDDSTNVQAVARGGSDTINDVTTNMTLDTDQGRTLFVYDSGNTNWKVYNV